MKWHLPRIEKHRIAILFLLLLELCCHQFYALAQHKEIFGTVLDEQRSPFGSVQVSIISKGLVVRQTTTEEDGIYVLGRLKKGNYDILFIAPGYSRYQINDVVVSDEYDLLKVNCIMNLGLESQLLSKQYRKPISSCFLYEPIIRPPVRLPSVGCYLPVDSLQRMLICASQGGGLSIDPRERNKLPADPLEPFLIQVGPPIVCGRSRTPHSFDGCFREKDFNHIPLEHILLLNADMIPVGR